MKKFLTIIISIVMFFSIISFTTLLAIRSIFSKNGINEILSVGTEELDMDTYVDEIFNSNPDAKELGKYVNIDEFSHAFSDYVADYLRYAAVSNGKQPSSDEMKRVIEDSVNKYEKENDVTLDDDLIDEVFDKFDDEMKEARTEIIDNNEAKVVFNVIYGNGYLVALGISIVCLILIFVINMSIRTVCSFLGVVTIINGVMTFLMSVIIKFILETEESLKGLASIVSTPFRNAALISLAIGIILLVVKVFIKQKKKEEVE